MRVGDLDTEGNTLAAAFTLSHGTCTSYSEVWNQNNQLDYFTRTAAKKQVPFRFFCGFFSFTPKRLSKGEKNSTINAYIL
jgi:hypothetical protein